MKIELIIMCVLAIGYLHGCGGGDPAVDTDRLPASPTITVSPTTGGQVRP